jgi:hypothetical protein
LGARHQVPYKLRNEKIKERNLKENEKGIIWTIYYGC